MTWKNLQNWETIYLNLGGGDNCHPRDNYKNYISVDLDSSESEYSIQHDLTKPIPLENNTVDRIHTEDFLEHIMIDDIKKLLKECYRILKPGGFLRIGVPDYNNPKDRQYMINKNDPRFPFHVTFTHYTLMKDIVDGSPFKRNKFYHYWEDNSFIQHPIDYSLGIIRRTPENHPRNRRKGIIKKAGRFFCDLQFKFSKNFNFSPLELKVRKGHPLHITSLVVDLYKD